MTSHPLWISGAVLFLIALGGSGCATAYPKVDLKDEDFRGKPLVIQNDVPFVEQSLKVCGPTALYMVAKPNLPDLKVEDVESITMTPAASGTYKQDLLAAARRLGLAPYAVKTVPEIFSALAAETPVIVFHRTNFLGKDYWHYSVLTGYDRPRENFYMHIGPDANHTMDVSKLVGAWEEGGRWSYVVLPPSKLPENAPFDEAIANSLAFLRLGMNTEASALAEATHARWPNRYEADVVLADALLKTNQSKEALAALRRASARNPKNPALTRKIAELTHQR